MYKPLFNRQESLVFKQFSRNGFSLYACLGRVVLISVLSVSTLEAAGGKVLNGNTEAGDSTSRKLEVTLEGVNVKGSRAPLTQSQASRMVTVLSREDISHAAVQSVNDLLKLAVGVDVRQRGAAGQQTDISVRGGTQEQITILLNGINVCDPQTGHNVMELPCQLDEIVRVEVLEGPAGRAYGTSSLVGAVNIVTRPARQSGVTATVEAGSYGYAAGNAVANISEGAWHNQLSLGYSRSDGYSRSRNGRLNTDYDAGKVFYQGQYDDSDVRVSWHAGLSDKGWGSSTFYATPTWQADEQFEHTQKIFTALQAETKKGFVHLRPALYWNRNHDRFEGYRDQPSVLKYNYNRCDVYGASLNSYFDWALGRTALGGELRSESLLSGNLGEALNEAVHIHGTDRDYTLGIDRTNVSLHLEHNILLKRFNLSAGLVATRNSWNARKMGVYPGVDASFQATGRLKLFASYNTSLRLPSFTEMYYKLPGYSANPYLHPEKMQAVEIGADLHARSIAARLSLYHHHGTDMIDWIMDTSLGAAAIWESVNHSKTNAYGVETELSADLNTMISRSSAFPLPKLTLSYSYISQDKDLEPTIISQYALEYLRHKLVGRVDWPLGGGFLLNIGMRWQDREGRYTTFTGEDLPYKPYFLADAKLAWEHNQYTLYAEATNLLNNKSYVDYGNVPQPGAWIVAGAKIKLNFAK